MQEEVGLLGVLLQQSKAQCASLQADNSQLQTERQDGLNRMANADSELSRQGKHISQVSMHKYQGYVAYP